jgi:hypothetical protein
MTAIADTPFAKLETEGRLLKPILNADTHVAGRFGYRGDISYDDPETVIKEVFSVSESGKPAIGFLAGSIKEYETLPKLVETFGPAFDGDGKYFIYIADLPQGNRFYIKFGDVKIFAIFIDETTVYNQLIDTFYVDKVKLDALGRCRAELFHSLGLCRGFLRGWIEGQKRRMIGGHCERAGCAPKRGLYSLCHITQLRPQPVAGAGLRSCRASRRPSATPPPARARASRQ